MRNRCDPHVAKFALNKSQPQHALTMNTTELHIDEFASSVLAVPPLARRADLSLDPAQNIALIRHIEAGGPRILLYGGNANMFHCSLPDYAELLELLATNTAETTRVIPSIGPDFGKMMDQARLLRGSGFRTAMVLPMQGATTPEGVADGIKRFVQAAAMPVTLYLKDERMLELEHIGQLVDQGHVLAVKYGLARANPINDPYLEALIQRIGKSRIISGMGERPVLAHMMRFSLPSFTTGSGCIAPRLSMCLLQALKRRDLNAIEPLHSKFLALENLRDSISLITVLHEAVTLTGVADMGPHLPLLSPPPYERMPEIMKLARALLIHERELQPPGKP